ncbi:MAG: acyltransferase [Bryobacteraceae bacterium]
MTPVTPASPPASGRIPSLDGLRAISIILVLIGHLNGTAGFGSHPWIRSTFGDLAHLGVVVFFVISGFLITTLLLKEHAKTGTVSLVLFYARRSIRIFPAALAFLAAMALAHYLHWIELHPRDMLHALTYTVNYHVNRSWFIGHLWSLSVEEQFYLLWPLTMLLLGPRRAFWFAAFMLVLSPCFRIAAWLFLRGNPLADAEMFPMVSDSLAAGCLLAGLRPHLESHRLYRHLLAGPSWLFLLAALLVLNRFSIYVAGSTIGFAIENLLIAALVHRAVVNPGSAFGSFLNSAPVSAIGVLSYSLYLWQQPFLNRHSSAWVNAFPQNLVLAIGMAVISYRLLEHPLNALRHRLRADSSPPRPPSSPSDRPPASVARIS